MTNVLSAHPNRPTVNKADSLDLCQTTRSMEAARLVINGQDTWDNDESLKRNYINTAARRVQVAANLISHHCKPFESLLEIGLSPGVGLAPVITANPGIKRCAALDNPRSHRVHALPAEKVSVSYEVDQKQIPLEFYWCNAEVDDFPFSEGTFDVVLCSDVLEHLLLDPYHLVTEVNRVLKPGGFFLLATSPSQGYWTHKFKLIIGRGIGDPYSGYGPYGRHNRLFLPSEVRALAEAGGFEIQQSITSGCYPGLPGNLTRAMLRLFRPIPAICDYLGSHIFVLGRKSSAPSGRPGWLYEQWDKRGSPENLKE